MGGPRKPRSLRAKAERIAEGFAEPQRGMAADLAENVLWMAVKLEETRREIADDPVAIPYDNGGGQTGIRKNPAFDGYNALMSSYTKALKQLFDLLGVEPDEGEEVCELDEIIEATAKSRKPRADKAG